MMQMVGAFAEFERAMIRERVSAGLAAAPGGGPHRRPAQEAGRCRAPRDRRGRSSQVGRRRRHGTALQCQSANRLTHRRPASDGSAIGAQAGTRAKRRNRPMPVSKKPRRESRRQRRHGRRPPLADGALPDRRAMESYPGGDRRASAAMTRSAKAQDVMYDAWEPRHLPLAHRARPQGARLSRRSAPMPTFSWPRRPRSVEEARDLLRQAASRPASWRSGHEGSRSMPAISGASSKPVPTCGPGPASPARSCKLGDVDGAIDHFRDMLKLNPNDNQGIRYLLLGCLLRHGRRSRGRRHCWQPTRTNGARAGSIPVRWLPSEDGHATEKKTARLVQDAWSANEHVPAHPGWHQAAGDLGQRLHHHGRSGRSNRLRERLRSSLAPDAGCSRLAEQTCCHLAKEAARPRNCPLTRLSVQFWTDRVVTSIWTSISRRFSRTRRRRRSRSRF